MYTGASILTYMRDRKNNKIHHLKATDDDLDLDEWDISYPGSIEERGFTEMFEFAYLMAFHFLAEVTQAPLETSSLFTCNTELYISKDDIKGVNLIYKDFSEWRKREKTLNNIKPIIYAHLELLELLYPTSKECSGVNNEMFGYFDYYNSVINGAESMDLIPMNFFRNMGTILADVV